MDFEREGIFIVPDMLRHGTSVFAPTSNWLPHLVSLYDHSCITNNYTQRKEESYITTPHPHLSFWPIKLRI